MELANFFILFFRAIYTYLVIPLTCTAGGCFPRARPQPPRKKTTSRGVFRPVLFPQESAAFRSSQLDMKNQKIYYNEKWVRSSAFDDEPIFTYSWLVMS